MDGPIVVVRQPGRRPLYVQVRDRLELGRDCDGLVLSDAQVSRRHAELRASGGRLHLVDLGSTNGTFVGEARLTEPVELRSGVVVRLGGTTVELAESSGSTSARTTSIAAAGSIDDLRRTSIDVVVESALAESWQPARATSDGGTVTILFSDIESSTQLATSMGDDAWFAVLGAHNRVFREQLARFGGHEVKSQGDGFMLTFPSARSAVRFAIATQRALDHPSQRDDSAAVRVRMGMHTGEAIVDDTGDLFGRHVIIASRVANLATGGEILVSSLVKEIVAARGDIVFGAGRDVGLKGIEGTQTVFEVDWRSSTPPV
jgi:class 3 adenylate cyclase